ncbi:hypothetical protein [Mastigocoleus sp. MO_188.B34]|uniref:hypothetical protein n=1 Tax=Mastigocoleus sp. MO_188.B34 TaxID=3036635 RepID=UPI002610DA7E|nr:hypothetical protein [Mastigocoleus sp. MO_188.B34]MDJ0693429.1 hypothetical protein [Mastigocoleus sp. MO_188.B34]
MGTNKRRGGYLATVEGVKKLKEAKRINKYTYENIREEAKVTLDQVKRLFNPQWGNGKYKIGEEAVEGMNHCISQKTYWRNGVIIENEKNKALVKADREDKKIIIRVKGPENTRRNLLSAIRSQFDYIHTTIPGITPQEKVPLLDRPETSPVDYQWLLNLERKGIRDFIPPGLTEERNIEQLLNGIDEPSKRRNEFRNA